MKHFFSLSKHPGKTGEYYYNTLFNKVGLPYRYTALECTNIKDSIKKLIDISASGISISMPFKHDVISLLDQVDDSVSTYQSCNTIKIENKKLIGYNTDCYGMYYVTSIIPENSNISILGDGAMGKMFEFWLKDRAVVYSRRLGNWDERTKINGTVINCTSYGTSIKDSPFKTLPNVDLVVDLCIPDNELKKQCQYGEVKYIDGLTFYRHQFKNQFEIYTGYSLPIDVIERL